MTQQQHQNWDNPIEFLMTCIGNKILCSFHISPYHVKINPFF